jgi:hypothetical protein
MSKQLRIQWRYNGLADYLRGVITVHQQFEDVEGLQIIPCICSNNKFSEAFEYVESIPQETWCHDLPVLDLEAHDVPEYWNQVRDALNTCGQIAITSYAFPDLGRKNIGDFRRLFVPKQSLQDIIGQKIRNIVTGDYEVIHVRVHLDEMFSDRRDDEIQKALEHIHEVISRTNIPIVLLADNFMVSELAPKSLLRSGVKPVHSFRHGSEVTESEVLDILTDLQIIIGAKKVTNITSFPWGTSGFSMIPCRVFGIPFEGIKVEL